MIDIRQIRETVEEVETRLAARGGKVELSVVLDLDTRRRELLKDVEALKEKRNRVSEEVGRLKKAGTDAAGLVADMQDVSSSIKKLDREVAECEIELRNALLTIPNLPHPTVPPGFDESDNPVTDVYGDKPEFSFEPADHVAIGEALGVVDFERSGKLAGARFSLMKGAGALLERALINFMLDLHTTEHGYTEILTPFMLKEEAFVGTGQLPKFEDDLYKIEGASMYLVPTAEVPVTNVHSGEILEETELPVSYAACTPCFRREAGSYGKDVKGLVRLHQFNKVELVKFTTPESSYDELDRLTSNASEVLKRLGLHYRVVTLCAGDLGFSAAKTFDLEVWLPGQGAYREISSCTNFEDFQARRANIKYRPAGAGGGGAGAGGAKKPRPRLLHTINGSGLAVGRTVVAILENFQCEDGSVDIPEVLRPYMGGLEKIEKTG